MKFTTSRSPLAVLSVIPLILFLTSFDLKALISPYYLSLDPSPDNEYPYLLNSLNILGLTSPGHTDHPGTPLQILGAVVILLSWLLGNLFHPFTPIADSVLKNPESYLNVIQFVLNLLISAGIFWAGHRIWLASEKISPALVFQFSMFLYPQILVSVTTVATEPLLIFAVAMLVSTIAPLAFRNTSSSETDPGLKRIAVWTGIVLGFGVATKIIFLPLVGVIFLFEESSDRKKALMAALISFILFTLPIVGQYPRMVKWFGVLLIHKGQYGTGGYGLPPPVSINKNFFYLLTEEPFLFISLGLYLIFSRVWIKPLLQLKWKTLDPFQKLTAVGCLIIILQILITIKHPGARYLLPSMVFASLLNSVLIYRYQTWPYSISSKKMALLAAFLIFFATGFLITLSKMQGWSKEVETTRISEEMILSKLKDFNRCDKVEYYRASLPEYAVAFGNDFASHRYNAQLSKIYPTAMFYNLWQGTFYSFTGVVEPSVIQKELAQGQCILMIGNPVTESYRQYVKHLDLKLIWMEPNEAVYQLVGLH